MILTSFSIRMIKDSQTRLTAVCNMVFDDMLAVCDVKIIKKDENSYFLAMPSRKAGENAFKDIAFPINAPTRQALERVIIGALTDTLGDGYDTVRCTNKSDKTSLYDQNASDFELLGTFGE